MALSRDIGALTDELLAIIAKTPDKAVTYLFDGHGYSSLLTFCRIHRISIS